jgi:hypothetical protein
MKLHQWGWVVVLLGAAMPAAADQVDINFSGDAAAFSYIKPLQTEGLELGGRWLHDTEDGDIADANLHMVDRPEPGRNALVLGIGGKLPAIMDDVRDADGAALAIGGKLRWTLPEYNRAAVAGSIYYAPSATSMSDIDGYQEYSVRGEFQLLEDANVYLGFRHIELSFDKDSDGADRDFEDGVYAGFNIDF